MDWYLVSAIFILYAIYTQPHVKGQYEWQLRDSFDEIRLKLDKVTSNTCPIHRQDDLYLPKDVSVSHLPNLKEMKGNPFFPNRTSLLHLHNMALGRAFFFSFTSQIRLLKTRTLNNDTHDPGMMYYFLSTVADVSSNPFINASAIYFAPNTSYSPSYRGFFNKTFSRFAPRTFREDDFNDPIHVERLSTLNTFSTQDLGAISGAQPSNDYSSATYRINEWYREWLPDENVYKRQDTKATYKVELIYSDGREPETYTFHGPPGLDEPRYPVQWTRPYFDCQRSNKWLVSAVSPIVDIYPRHTKFRHIEYPTYTAIAVMEIDFERIDINQCPVADGNRGPNMFADTARCKKETTECEPLFGWGFRRGGYQCRCNPGFRLPNVVRRPFLGEIVERATADLYLHQFDCLKIGWIQKIINIQTEEDIVSPEVKAKYLEIFHEYKNYSRGARSLRDKKKNVREILAFIKGVREHNCHQYTTNDLTLTGDFSYGASEQFANQARMAVRLSNFISAFLQISDPKETYSETRVADKPLSEDQIIGETMSLVMGDEKVLSAGTYWERNKFTNKTFFSTLAYRPTTNENAEIGRTCRVEINSTDDLYTRKVWFQSLKQRWLTNFDSLEKYYMKLKIRYNETGDHLKKYEHYPVSYRAANLEGGYWSTPYFDCKGSVKKWLITYASPFFGWDSLRNSLEFKGVVTVSMDLLQLDINQCNGEYYTPNAFKDTHKCDRKTSYCFPLLGRGYEAGAYKCECLQGYEYPFEDAYTYYDGQLVESEFENLVEDKATKYDWYQCRLAGASATEISLLLLIATSVAWLW